MIIGNYRVQQKLFLTRLGGIGRGGALCWTWGLGPGPPLGLCPPMFIPIPIGIIPIGIPMGMPIGGLAPNQDIVISEINMFKGQENEIN